MLLAGAGPAQVVSATATNSPAAKHFTATRLAASNGSWTTYHHDNAHTGYDAAAPALGTVGVTAGWTEAALDGEVFGEPLIYSNLVYTATLSNTVYALNQATGAVAWHTNLGAPETTGWGCGNVSPQGILGTPVIDTTGGRIYVAALLSDNVYRVFGLDLVTGNVVLTTALSLGTAFDWRIEQQRGALSLANGQVYVPFGGRAGDCGNYHGFVVGVPTSGATTLNVYQTPSSGSGLWAAGGLAIDDTTGNVFATTGNGVAGGCSAVNQNDAVVRLSPTLALQDYFMPQDWQANWCSNDQDLGSAGPLLISPSLLFTSGKWGGGFLLNPTSLGGVDGQRFPTPKPAVYSQAEACLGNHSNATFGSFAYAAPFVYVECEGRGLVALNVNTATPSFDPCPSTCGTTDWHALNGTTLGPPIVAAGAVWAVSNGGGLYAFNATTGGQIFHSAGFGVNRFVTPAEAGGQVFVPSHTSLKSFTFGGSGAVSASPSNLDFGGQAPNTTSAAQTATLHNGQTIALHVASAALGGTSAGQYIKGTDGCSGATIAAGGNCTVTVSFHPTGFGGFPASLVFSDDAAGSPRTVPLGGLGALDNLGHLYTLDGYGGVHADGSAPPLTSSVYWAGWNIARSIALFPDGLGGYLLDGYGGIHGIGNAPPASPNPDRFGWDIARQVALAPWSSRTSPAGWTLDGYGGIHPFGGAPAITNYVRWGWDIARSFAILPDSTPGAVGGYTLDGYGGVHPFGNAPSINNYTRWGWDIARGIALNPGSNPAGPSGWTLDGYGGLHPFGSAPAITDYARWGFDIGRGVIIWTGSGAGAKGWVLEGYGGIHPFGGAPSIPGFPYWPGWDIATSLTGGNFGTGSRGRT